MALIAGVMQPSWQAMHICYVCCSRIRLSNADEHALAQRESGTFVLSAMSAGHGAEVSFLPDCQAFCVT